MGGAEACCLLGGWWSIQGSCRGPAKTSVKVARTGDRVSLGFLWKEYLCLCTVFARLLLHDLGLIPGCCYNAIAV